MRAQFMKDLITQRHPEQPKWKHMPKDNKVKLLWMRISIVTKSDFTLVIQIIVNTKLNKAVHLQILHFIPTKMIPQ